MSRFTFWVIELGFSVALFLSLHSIIKEEEKADGVSEGTGGGVVVSVIALLLHVTGCFLSLLPTHWAVVAVESILVVIVAGFWVTIMTATMVASMEGYEILDQKFAIDYPPVYFSSWGITITSIMSFAALYKEIVYHGKSNTATQWCLMTFISLFVTLSSIEFLQYKVDVENPTTGVTSTVPICTTEDYSCTRVHFAIVLGTVTCPVAFLTFVWRTAPLGCETDVALLLFIGWCCGAAYLTYAGGPGSEVGNIYFGTWTNFFLCLRIIIVTLSENETSIQATLFVDNQRMSVVDVGEIFDMAHDRLEIRGFSPRDSSLNARAISASLFEPVESWSFAEDSHTVSPDEADREPANVADSDADVLEPNGPQRRNRLEMWAMVLTGSSVCLSSLLPTLPTERSSEQNFKLFIISASIVNASVGFLLLLGSFRVEAVSIAASTIFWLVGLPVITRDDTSSSLDSQGNDSPEAGLLESPGGSNVFFSAYGCLVISLLMTTNWFTASQTTTCWVILSGFSFTLMASSLYRLRHEVGVEGENGSFSEMPECEVMGGVDLCDRVYFAMVLGATSTAVSVLMALLFGAPVVLHLIAGLAIFGAWCAGVVFITFGGGQGEEVSSAFFGTWFALFASLNIAATNFVILVKRRAKKRDEEEAQAEVDRVGSGGDATQPHVLSENDHESIFAD